MKNLLRMSLFIIARAGSCLAVVAWIVSQSYSSEAFGGFTPASAFCFTGRPGIIIGFTNDDARWRFNVSERQSFRMLVFYYSEPEYSEVTDWITIVEPVSGLILFSDSSGVGLAFRHYLVVTFFARFYGVLKWVYRSQRLRRQAMTGLTDLRLGDDPASFCFDANIRSEILKI